jgi:CheY-like chemotaxis protein
MARILIAEPVAETRELMARLVERLGHEPVWPDDPPERVAGADVALLDPVGPAGEGALRILRTQTPDTRLVISSIEPPSPASRALGAAAHLLKPFGLADLRRALESALPPTVPAA